MGLPASNECPTGSSSQLRGCGVWRRSRPRFRGVRRALPALAHCPGGMWPARSSPHRLATGAGRRQKLGCSWCVLRLSDAFVLMTLCARTVCLPLSFSNRLHCFPGCDIARTCCSMRVSPDAHRNCRPMHLSGFSPWCLAALPTALSGRQAHIACPGTLPGRHMACPLLASPAGNGRRTQKTARRFMACPSPP